MDTTPAASRAATLPAPAFRLRWHAVGARYTVSEPNIGDTDCYTADQISAAFASLDAEKPASHATLTDEQIDKVFIRYAGANENGTPYLSAYREGFGHIVRDLLAALASPQVAPKD